MKGHARNVMTEHVTSVDPATPLETIARIMVAGGFGGVPVVDDDHQVLGFVGEAELVGALLRDAGPQVKARDVMTRDPVLVDEFETTDEVMRIMREKQTDHLLVVRAGRLVGIIAPIDVLRFFVEHVLPPPPEVG
jgi:predicted transcriptional regulator